MEPNHTTQTNEKNTGMGILAYLGILIIIPFLTGSYKDPFVKFHIKQGLVLLIVDILVSFVVRGSFVWFLSPILGLAVLVYVIIGIMNVVAHREKELPYIGQLAKHFNF